MSISEIQRLLDRYLSGECSAAEQSQVEEWLEKQETTDNDWTKKPASAREEWVASLYKDIKQSIEAGNKAQANETKVISMYSRHFLRIAVAASVLIMIAAASYFMFFRKPQKEIVQIEVTPDKINNDIAPGGNKAILTLADNSTINLENAQKGTLTRQGNTRISKLDDGQLAYTPGAGGAGTLYNTIATPRGGQYQLVLPDGSKVWLNAASTLRFPTAFTGKERRVEVTGEAYFEVAKNPGQPFIVTANNMDVQALGTEFNINAYADESAMFTTLIEGNVKVSSKGEAVIIKPGQQTGINNNENNIHVADNVDIAKVIAWKKGLFEFNKTGLPVIMRQISRWYDVDILYEGKVTEETFGGGISRNLPLSDILKLLEGNGVQFRVEGKKVFVRS